MDIEKNPDPVVEEVAGKKQYRLADGTIVDQYGRVILKGSGDDYSEGSDEDDEDND